MNGLIPEQILSMFAAHFHRFPGVWGRSGETRWQCSGSGNSRPYHGRLWNVVVDAVVETGAGNVHFMDTLHQYPTIYTRTTSWLEVEAALAGGPVLPH